MKTLKKYSKIRLSQNYLKSCYMGHFLTLFNNFLKKVRKILCQLKFYGDFCIGPDDKNRREAIFGTKIEICACGGLDGATV